MTPDRPYPPWRWQAAGLFATLLSCALVTGILVVFGGPDLLVRWRGDAAVAGTLLDEQGQPLPHQPVALIVRQADGRTYRAETTTDGAGWFRTVISAAALRPGPAIAYLESTLADGTVARVVLADLRGGQTLRGRWELTQSRP